MIDPDTLPDTSGLTDDELLRRLGYDPALYYVEHCAHCDRSRSNEHWSCMVFERPKPIRWWQRVHPIFAWYDLWMGLYWDAARRRLYILPLPCVGVYIQL